MSVNRLSRRRHVIAMTAAAVTGVVAACKETTSPTLPARSVTSSSAHPALAVGANTIVFQRDSGIVPSGIYTMNDDGTNLTRLRDGESPAWSPDHSKIVFKANNTIFLMNANGTDAKPLTGVADDQQPSFNANGSQVVFVRLNAKAGASEIMTINVDGTNPRLLLKLAKTSLNVPRISPDGTKLAVQASRRSDTDILVVNLSNGRRTVVAGGPNNEQSPVWSPDSKRLAFLTGQLDKGKCIAIVNADGTGVTSFTNDVAFCSAVSWSPDGKELAFTSVTAGTAGIYRAPIDGAATPTRLTTPSGTALDAELSWTR